MALALFDLDNTLLNGDSDYEWGRYLVDYNYVDPVWYQEKNDYFYQQYVRGELDIVEYSQFAFTPLVTKTMEELSAMHKVYMKHYIEPIMSDKSKALIQYHKDQNDTLLVITATNHFVVKPIIEAYGIAHFLATEPKISNNRYVTEIKGVACFQEGKVTRLNEWLDQSNEVLDGSTFYSDSFNDLSLLTLVDRPVAVDPDEKLECIAKEKGWEIISLR